MVAPELVRRDPWLEPYTAVIRRRGERFRRLKSASGDGFTKAHEFYGEHLENGRIIIREWAPNAQKIELLCDAVSWRPGGDLGFRRLNDYGDWELSVGPEVLTHGSHYRLHVSWEGGCGERIPAYARRVEQDPDTAIFTARIWFPETGYNWRIKRLENPPAEPIVYEAHIGMALEEGGVGGFNEFRRNILPRIEAAGFNTLQLMALMEHPYYASFGYQVSNFFALSSRYGTPEDFKELVDQCHMRGIRVIMDLVHSHAVRNEVEGIGMQDGSEHLYFHSGPRGEHPAWNSRCFDYGKAETRNFLLSNCRFWIEEYGLDGFRFDGVTSMLYLDHGLGVSFDHYDKYFGGNVDEDAVLYLMLANDLIHGLNPDAVTIAEDMSGMPGIAAPIPDGGFGFDYRLTMGLPDYWIKIIKEKRDEDWRVSELWDVLNNRRCGEKHIAYSESHDQALVGDKTIIFRLMDAAMYSDMAVGHDSPAADRGVGLFKLINLLCFAAGGEGFMCFMGNEFGHPEWIDFPREGNGWSYHYARRQWSLADNRQLRYSRLLAFTSDMQRRCESVLADSKAELVHIHDDDGVLAFTRGGLLFICNINSSRSFTEYGLHIYGKWRLILNTDSEAYDGHGRVPDELELESSGGILKMYLPTRTAFVFRRNADEY